MTKKTSFEDEMKELRAKKGITVPVAPIKTDVIRKPTHAAHPPHLSSLFFCTSCESINIGTETKKGSVFVTLLLLLLGILPGIIYMIYRSNSRKMVCLDCGSASLIPVMSAKVKKIFGDDYEDTLNAYAIHSEKEYNKRRRGERNTHIFIFVSVALFCFLLIIR